MKCTSGIGIWLFIHSDTSCARHCSNVLAGTVLGTTDTIAGTRAAALCEADADVTPLALSGIVISVVLAAVDGRDGCAEADVAAQLSFRR